MNLSDDEIWQLKTYEKYLSSLLKAEDFFYLESNFFSEFVAELGYHSVCKPYSRQQFLDRLDAIEEIRHPTFLAHKMFSYGLNLEDPLLRELAARERPNRVGSISTIIFIRLKKPTGAEVSGYIDYEQSLRKAKTRQRGANDWFNIFRRNKLLLPRKIDLGYYDWFKTSVVNKTDNYKPLCDPDLGLVFLNRKDRKVIMSDPFGEDVGTNSFRTAVK